MKYAFPLLSNGQLSGVAKEVMGALCPSPHNNLWWPNVPSHNILIEVGGKRDNLMISSTVQASAVISVECQDSISSNWNFCEPQFGNAKFPQYPLPLLHTT